MGIQSGGFPGNFTRISISSGGRFKKTGVSWLKRGRSTSVLVAFLSACDLDVNGAELRELNGYTQRSCYSTEISDSGWNLLRSQQCRQLGFDSPRA